MIYININEEFSISKVVKKFRIAHQNQNQNTSYSVYFSISCFAPLEEIDQFFFSLIFTNLIYDKVKGNYFSLENPTHWNFYVEIPCSTVPKDISMEEINDFVSEPLLHKFPSLFYCAKEQKITGDYLFDIDSKTRFVCLILFSYLEKLSDQRRMIDLNVDEIEKMKIPNVKNVIEYVFTFLDKLKSEEKCREILKTTFTKYMVGSELWKMKKIHHKYFVSYLSRRFNFLSSNSQFKKNDFGNHREYSSYLRLGSILVSQMLHEGKIFLFIFTKTIVFFLFNNFFY